MIEGKNFKILEFQDIVATCNNMEEAGNAIGEKLKTMNVDGKGEQDRAEFMGDLLTVLAAGVGAAMAKAQGGLVMLKEGASPEDHKEAVAALEELRKKSRAAAAATPGGIPQ